MSKMLIVKADTNDADYIEESSYIDDDELERFMPLIQAIKNNKSGHNWEYNDYTNNLPTEMYSQFDKDLVDEFGEYVPRGEYGVHSIESIRVLTISDEQTLL